MFLTIFFLGSFFSSVYNLYQSYLLDFVVSFMLSIMVFVLCLVFFVLFNFSGTKFMSWNKKWLEFWCGAVPIMILFFQGVFSFGFLYYDSLVNGGGEGGVFPGSKLDVNVVGRQWFWVYEYGGLGSWMKFDSYLLGYSEMELGGLRMLEVDNRLVLPLGYYNRLNITSNDVIHSWFLPSYGFKMDALPGVVNTHLLRLDCVGVFYGMCSEICGAGHSYMPVVVECIPDNVFFSWVEDYKHKFDIVTRLGDWYKVHGVSSFV